MAYDYYSQAQVKNKVKGLELEAQVKNKVKGLEREGHARITAWQFSLASASQTHA